MTPLAYAPLWCKSNFSFLEGASHPEELVQACADLGLACLALTDRDGVYGVVEAYTRSRETGVRLIVGSEVTIDDGTSIVLLAADRAGYANLCRLLTVGRRRSPKGESRVCWPEVCDHARGLIALWGGDRSLLVGPADPFFVAHELRAAFGDRLYALAARHSRAAERRYHDPCATCQRKPFDSLPFANTAERTQSPQAQPADYPRRDDCAYIGP